MGGLVRILPFSYAMFFIGSLALMGFPFLTGFYSKDLILEVAFAKYGFNGHFAHWLGTLAAFFTAFYSIRLLYLTFLSENNSYRKVVEGAHDAPLPMALPLFLLSIGSIFVGYLGKDMIVGLGTDFWGNALFIHPSNIATIDAEFIPHYIKSTPVIFSVSGGMLAFILYNQAPTFLYNLKTSGPGYYLYIFLNRKWLFDKVYNETVSQRVLSIGYDTTYKIIDRGLFEFFGPYGISKNIYKAALNIQKFQSGHIFHYAFLMLIGLTSLISLIGLWDIISIYLDGRLLFIFMVLFLLTQKLNTYKHL